MLVFSFHVRVIRSIPSISIISLLCVWLDQAPPRGRLDDGI